LPLTALYALPSQAYHEAVSYHRAHYLLRWEWYEWVGVLAPVGLLWWFRGVARSRRWWNMERMCRGLILYDLAYFAAALVLSVPRSFESLARLQPLRSLHLLYILMFLFAGGLLGEYVLNGRAWC